MRVTVEFMKSWGKIFLVLAVGLWLATGCAIISRIQLVFDYSTLPLVPPEYEVIAGSASAIAALVVPMTILGLLWFLGSEARFAKPSKAHFIASPDVTNLVFWFAASLPLLLLVLRVFEWEVPPPSWWELAWFAGWTGMGTKTSLRHQGFFSAERRWPWYVFLAIAVASCTWWWLSQSIAYHQDYQLGFNDFGHFTQRISNTTHGNGFLLESPVLPPFWDHFNPGLLLIVPLWSICPSVELIFAIQAACLAGSACLVAAIARSRKQSAFTACGLGCTWLLYPSIGQMNIAYTYGWHPITLAIPSLLAAFLFLVRGRVWIAVVFTILAASFEEGVLVVIACYAATQALRLWLQQRRTKKQLSSLTVGAPRADNTSEQRALRGWLLVTCVSSVCFFVVYQYSGLAPFQTGRFTKLGNNAAEIIGSPILKPDVFLGLLLRPRNLSFAVFLLLPFAVAGSMSPGSRAWLWSIFAISPPIFVLMIWEHMPAQSLAFQYASCLIPILFVGIIETTTSSPNPENRAMGMLATVWILSIAIGQMPWSNDTLVDVKAKTYGLQSIVGSSGNRVRGSKDSEWITAWIHAMNHRTADSHVSASAIEKLPAWQNMRVLATGRLSAHFVGVGDVETVGQFWQRYDSLKSLEPTLASPILRYDIILLDLHESFQQTPEETVRVSKEAEKHGWRIFASNFDFILLAR